MIIILTSFKCIASSNKCLTSSNKKLTSRTKSFQKPSQPPSTEVAEEVDGWLRLAADEAWARSIAAGFVLLDGKALGSSNQLEVLCR